MTRVVVSAALISVALIGAVQAQTTGTATTDLNIRSGPGPEQPVIGLIKARQQRASWAASRAACGARSISGASTAGPIRNTCRCGPAAEPSWCASPRMSQACRSSPMTRRSRHADLSAGNRGARARLRPRRRLGRSGGAGAAAIGAPDPYVNVVPVTPPPAVGAM